MIRSSDAAGPDPERLARATDPETSHLSAEETVREGKAASIAALVLLAVQAQPGQTAGELSEATGLAYDQVWRRCSDLKKPTKTRRARIKEGPLRRWPRTGRLQVTLWPVEETQAVLL